MQEVFIVTSENGRDNIVNGRLSRGWVVIGTCPMPSSVGECPKATPPTCMVILEKKDEAQAT